MNSKKRLHLQATRVDTFHFTRDDLHKLYKDFMYSAEEESLLLVDDDFCYLDREGERKIISKKTFDAHFSATIEDVFDRLLFSLKDPYAKDRMSIDAIFVYLNIFSHPIFNNCCIEKYMKNFTEQLDDYLKNDPNADDTRIHLATYISAYGDVRKDISPIKEATEYLLKNKFISAKSIGGSDYFKRYLLKDLFTLSNARNYR